MTTSHPMRLGPFCVSAMCRMSKGGVTCVICGRFDANPGGRTASARCERRVGRVFTQFGKRSPSTFVLSLHCGPNNCLDYTASLKDCLTPTTSLKGMFYAALCGSVDSPRGVSFPLGAKLTSRGLGLDGLCMLADGFATSTSRTIVGYLHPCVNARGMIMVNRAAINGGMTVRPCRSRHCGFVL